MAANRLVPILVALCLSAGAGSAVAQALQGGGQEPNDPPADPPTAERSLETPGATDPLLGLELETLRTLFREMEEEVELLRERVDALEARQAPTEQ